ncbi:MAG: EamA family transporter RarD [Deltaproteobacteria bacterium]|nr:EamA family transporter RarD [Deltaproteobacteria bacterium]
MTPPSSNRSGLGFAVLAYGLWGVVPLYWKQLGHVAPLEILAHRVVGGLVVGLALLAWRGGLASAWKLLRASESRRVLVASTALIAANWGLFIWAVVRGRLAEASLGYFVNPLCNALLGRVVLGERMSRGQAGAVLISAVGVAWLAATGEHLPWLALALATTFSTYGLLRKRAPAGAVEGFTLEAVLVAPLAVGYLAMRTPPFGVVLTSDATTRALLLGAGVVTAVPLLSFAAAARRLSYTALGMVQFLSPTLQLACAVLLFGEPFSLRFAIAFAAIATGAAIFALDAVLRETRRATTVGSTS